MQKQIVAPELTIKFTSNMKMSERPQIRDSLDGVSLIREFWDENFLSIREEAKMILLSTNNRVLGVFSLSVGGVNATVVDPAIVFLIALRTPGVKQFILAHNHPSGNAQPSKSDITLTDKIKAGAELLGLKLMDHYIITTEDYVSMADQGLL